MLNIIQLKPHTESYLIDKAIHLFEYLLANVRLIYIVLQLTHLNDLVRSDIVQTAFKNTQDTTPDKSYEKIIEALTAR